MIVSKMNKGPNNIALKYKIFVLMNHLNYLLYIESH